MNARKILLLAILAMIVVAAAFVGNWVWTGLTSGPTISYNGEITVYNGQKLGSINDFRLEAINGVQYINVSSYRLVVKGLVQNQTVYTYDDIVNNHTSYEKVVKLHCVEGWEVTALWQGVRVKDLLEEAGYDHSAKVVIFYAQDGYTTSLPLSYIVGNNIMIAYKINNVTLPAREGFPFQLVAEGKYGYKWIKWITTIEVSNDTSFRGYWESYGYDNNADLP
ncbi:MAG: molybdopterin-dependent oxidoreductase [Candidatus Bathyarchaeia archaeon]